MDDSTSVSELKTAVRQFVAERDWSKFHSAKNLSMAIAIEAAELMDLFTWQTEETTNEYVAGPERLRAVEEIADVLIFALAFANQHGIDVSEAVAAKLVKNREKYPAAAFKGHV